MLRHLLLALLLNATAMANLSNCFSGFAAVADDPEARQRLIVATYRRLLDTLGGDRLSAEAIERMMKDSPLQIPESETESLNLRRNLARFEEMLKKEGWASDETVQQLKQELGVYRTAIGQQRAKRSRALRAELKDVEVVFPGSPRPEPRFLPGGRFTVAMSAQPRPGKTDELSYFVHDSETGELRHLPRPKSFSDIWFAPQSGQSLYFRGSSKDMVREVPFADGELQWAAVREYHLPGNTINLQNMKATNVPGEFLVDVSAFRLDLLSLEVGRTGYHSTTHPTPEGSNPTSTGFGWVPGKDQFYYTVRNQNGHFLQLIDRPSGTNMSLAEAARPLPDRSGPVKWSSDGQFIIASGEGPAATPSIYVAPSATGGAFERVKTSTNEDTFPGAIQSLIPYPDRSASLVLFRGRDGKSYVEYIDLAQGKGIKRIPLSESQSLPDATITEDGSRLIYRTGPGKMRTLNLDREFPFDS